MSHFPKKLMSMAVGLVALSSTKVDAVKHVLPDPSHKYEVYTSYDEEGTPTDEWVRTNEKYSWREHWEAIQEEVYKNYTNNPVRNKEIEAWQDRVELISHKLLESKNYLKENAGKNEDADAIHVGLIKHYTERLKREMTMYENWQDYFPEHAAETH